MAGNWSTTWDTKPNSDEAIVQEAQDFYKYAYDWEAEARTRFDYDYKFSNGDTHNKFQWDSTLVDSRELLDKPVLTINKTQQHNLMIINDAKQNKPGVRIRPVGEEASFEAAQIFQELVYHIEYISGAENIYDSAVSWQVQAGIGYWRINTDYINDKSFDQEIYIKHIKDPRSVYMDPDISEIDGSDAKKAIIFEDVKQDTFKAENPGVEVGPTTLGNNSTGWITKDHIRIAEYYRKVIKKDKLVTFTTEADGTIIKKLSELGDLEKLIYNEIRKGSDVVKATYNFKERSVLSEQIEWYKIAGDKIIERSLWLGKYIPIVRIPGIETVIDGILDRKGHTRALINAQQMYNYNTSANIEFGALQTKAPWLAPSAAIENFEEYYETANDTNHSYLPYNHIDEDGNEIPPPSRPAAPQSSPSYIEGLKIAQNEMMMASGQYQAQLGENENAKSGIAINARQRQGDRATYHFLDNQAIGIRFTGKIIIDLIPKIYDTKRVRKIQAIDGSIMNVTIDPQADQAHQKIVNPQDRENDQQVKNIIFNPNVGMYDIQSDPGPSFATRRQEAYNALTQIAVGDKQFMGIAGDLLWKVADFPEADVLAQRYRKVIPPNILGDTPDPQTEEMMHKASDKIIQLQDLIKQMTEELKNKQGELEIKTREMTLREKEVSVEQQRLDYDAETKRLTALGNSGPGLSVEQIQPVVRELLQGMIQNGELSINALPGPHEGGMVPGQEDQLGSEPANPEPPEGEGDSLPDVPGSRQASDGKHYVKHPNGSFLEVQANAP